MLSVITLSSFHCTDRPYLFVGPAESELKVYIIITCPTQSEKKTFKYFSLHTSAAVNVFQPNFLLQLKYDGSKPMKQKLCQRS